MNEEQDLEIIENGKFKNITLKTTYKKNGSKFVIVDGKKVIDKQGLEDGNYIIVTKVYAEDRPMPNRFEDVTSYSCLVQYKDQEVSFFLNDKVKENGYVMMKEHIDFEACGGIGTKVKITLNNVPYINSMTGAEGTKPVLSFEKVE